MVALNPRVVLLAGFQLLPAVFVVVFTPGRIPVETPMYVAAFYKYIWRAIGTFSCLCGL